MQIHQGMFARGIADLAQTPQRPLQTHLWGFFTPPVAGADLRAALVASCLRGALPPVDLRAVCLVRAMVIALRLLFKHLSSLPVVWRDFAAIWLTFARR